MTILSDESKSFIQNIEAEQHMSLELITGTDPEGGPQYALLLLPSDKVKDLRLALARNTVTLEEYGRVLAKGAGKVPPEGLVEDIIGLMTKK